MVFSSITFIFFFLPAVLAAYHLAPRRVRNGLLVFASLGFYAWGAGAFVPSPLGDNPAAEPPAVRRPVAEAPNSSAAIEDLM